MQALDEGLCRPLGNSRYLLVDFPEAVSFFEIQSAMGSLQRTGYHPILAHTERYICLFTHMDWVRGFVEDGGIVQINASSATGSWGTLAKMQWKRLVKEGLAHIVASDGHNLTSRQPKISVCLPYLNKYCSPRRIRELTWDNACRVIRDESF
jgi:protein-tyrosine phosphatase